MDSQTGALKPICCERTGITLCLYDPVRDELHFKKRYQGRTVTTIVTRTWLEGAMNASSEYLAKPNASMV